MLRLPADLTAAEEQRVVATLLDRLRARALALPPPIDGLPDEVPTRLAAERVRQLGPRGDLDLVRTADLVADRWLDGVRAASVRWSPRMSTLWASCSVDTRRIRVSDRLATAPDVVLEHILLHELAHLVERGHGAAFAALVGRDPNRAAVDQWLARRSALTLRAALEDDGLMAPAGDLGRFRRDRPRAGGSASGAA